MLKKKSNKTERDGPRPPLSSKWMVNCWPVGGNGKIRQTCRCWWGRAGGGGDVQVLVQMCRCWCGHAGAGAHVQVLVQVCHCHPDIYSLERLSGKRLVSSDPWMRLKTKSPFTRQVKTIYHQRDLFSSIIWRRSDLLKNNNKHEFRGSWW